MPEGHSIRRLADKWTPMIGQSISVTSPQGRFSEGAERIDGARLTATSAHGKHLFLHFGSDILHVHLGLYGRFRFHRKSKISDVPGPVVGQVRARFEWTTGWADLSGPTQCEVIDADQKQTIHERLGPDPLHSDASIEPLLPWASKSSWPVGRTVLDQSKIAGIGNVYRAELLFMLGWDPERLTSGVREQEWDDAFALARQLLQAGVQAGRIVTTAKTLPPPATLPPGTACASRTYVYKRTGSPCVACGTVIESKEQASRTLYWCPTCQVIQ